MNDKNMDPVTKFCKDLGFDSAEDLFDKTSQDDAVRKHIIVQARAKLLGIGYALGDGHSIDKKKRNADWDKRMAHLRGLREVAARLLLLLKDNEVTQLYKINHE